MESSRGAADYIGSGGAGDTGDPGFPPDRPARFPWRDVLPVVALVGLHLAVVAWHAGLSGGDGLLRRLGLIAGRTAAEPWRLVSSLFLHADVAHALWNGVSMLVFAVPLLSGLGRVRTGLIYVAAGAAGGVAAVGFAPAGTVIVGSSGAVAGLFGAWVVLRLRAASHAEISWVGRVRAIGIALLVLPSLLSPVTRSGRPISVSAHLGGMATGMLIGASLSRALIPRAPLRTEDGEYLH
jgi:rhomboid protease GluP